ncbi:MAG: iron-only hydrogenase system regulator [Candidatus Omnitrophica bacterium]|nr:iron-only hydrogenase system regulator [Candidatus Omnitrophota bacterium]MBU1657266.1 iron-only hydrogenase system regulator [Candidatus Omnitrophota bacterium]MBU1783939.1 iron-only hydrogenase system regulator [Candidatus Omnitrophota bacterium]
MEKRLGFVGIIIEDRKKAAKNVNEVLLDNGDIIAARMGVPYIKENRSIITLVIDATTDELGALTGRIGAISGVMVKSALGKKAST